MNTTAWTPTLEGFAEGPFLLESCRDLARRRRARREGGFAVLDYDPARFATLMRGLVLERRWIHGTPRMASIPKASGATRQIAVFPPEEQALHAALAGYLGLWLERHLLRSAWAFRPGRSADGARRQAARQIQAGATFVADVDIRDCFDAIPRAPLLDHLTSLGLDDPALRELIRRATGSATGAPRGLPQGSALSPVLCNAWLHRVDVALRDRPGYLRYADDIVCLEANLPAAEAAFARIETALVEGGQQVQRRKSGVKPIERWAWLGATWSDGRWEKPPARPAFMDPKRRRR